MTGLPGGARRWERLVAADPRRLFARPAPPIRLEGVRLVRAWVLRVALLLVGVAGVLLVTPVPAEVAIGVTVAVLATVWPGSGGPAGLVGVLALGVVARLEPFAWQAFAVLGVVHLVVRLGALCATTGLATGIDVALLRHEARTWVGVQACAQVIALGASLLPPSVSAAGAGYKMIGLVAVGVLAVLMLPRGGTAREPETGLVHVERPEDDDELGDDGQGPARDPGGMGSVPGESGSRWG